MTDIYEKLREQTRNIDWSKVHVDSDRRPPLEFGTRRKVPGSDLRISTARRVTGK